MTYYVSLSGNDTNKGTDSATPWATLQAAKLSAGDTVLFQGGSTFPGGYTLPVPVTLDSYNGVATLSGGVTFSQCAGTIRNLNLIGTDQPGSYGILFQNTNLQFVYGGLVKNCLVRDFDTGIGFQGQLDGVVVEDCEVAPNLNNGIATVGGPPQDFYTLKNITIKRCYVHGNAGTNPSPTAPPSGSGITMNNCQNLLVDSCQVVGNGANGNSNCGISIANAADCVISNNQVWGQQSAPNATDGDGIDIDVSCLRCIIEDNYVEQSYGAGITVFGNTLDVAEITKDCIIRRNVVYNNGTGGQYPNLLIDAPVDNLQVYQNIFQVDPGMKTPPVANVGINANLAPLSHGVAILFHDNILQCPAGMRLVQAGNFQGVKMVNNAYVSYDTNNKLTFLVNWGTTDYTSLSAWKAASGQESS